MSSFFTVVEGLDQERLTEEMVRQDVAVLLAWLESVPDPRDPRGVRFDLPLLLGLGVFATCCKAETFEEIAEVVADADPVILAGFGLVRTPPSAATFRRVLNAADPVALDEALSTWAAGLPAGAGPAEPQPVPAPVSAPAAVRGRLRVVSLDGKTMKGARSFDGSGVMSQVAVLEAVDQDTRWVPGQVQVVGGDENAAGIAMVDRLAARPGGLAGTVIVADAKHTTRALAEKITAAGGHYVFTVKGNAPTTLAALKSLPWPQIAVGDAAYDKDHGRKETRTIRVVQVPDHLDVVLPGAVQAARIRRTVWRKKTVTSPHAWTHETVHILTSLPPGLAHPSRLAAIVRGQWLIEAHHWIRDTAFNEDRHTARTGHGPVNLACLRNTAITRHQQTGTTNTTRSLRASNRHPRRALDIIAK